VVCSAFRLSTDSLANYTDNVLLYRYAMRIMTSGGLGCSCRQVVSELICDRHRSETKHDECGVNLSTAGTTLTSLARADRKYTAYHSALLVSRFFLPKIQVVSVYSNDTVIVRLYRQWLPIVCLKDKWLASLAYLLKYKLQLSSVILLLL